VTRALSQRQKSCVLRQAQGALILALSHSGLGRSNWTTIIALRHGSSRLTRRCGGRPVEHACSRGRSAGHPILITVLPLIIRATGRVLGTPSTRGLMALSARLAREGMLRTVIPLKLYRNSIFFAGAASARFVRLLTRPPGTKTGWSPALIWI
jgi:hypothetical protein